MNPGCLYYMYKHINLYTARDCQWILKPQLNYISAATHYRLYFHKSYYNPFTLPDNGRRIIVVDTPTIVCAIIFFWFDIKQWNKWQINAWCWIWNSSKSRWCYKINMQPTIHIHRQILHTVRLNLRAYNTTYFGNIIFSPSILASLCTM